MRQQLSRKIDVIDKQVGSLAHRYETGEAWIIALAILVGLLAGCAAALLKYMIGTLSRLLTAHLNPGGANWLFILLPVIGVLLAAMYQKFILKKDIYHGVLRLNNALVNGRYVLPTGRMISPLIASTLTLGFGGSAGSEGPIAYTGAAIGSNVGRRFGLSDNGMKIMIACGAAAGIAGIFKAPVGGALFALEVLTVELSTVAVVAVFAAALVSGLTAFALSNFSADIVFNMPYTFDPHILPMVIALGVFCGLYSVYYAFVMDRISLWFERFNNFWVKAVVAGLMIGVAIYFFPALYGEGYDVISGVLAIKKVTLTQFGLWANHAVPTTTLVLLILGGMLLVKCWVTAATTSGGGVAGDFAPSLFAGCMAGFFFAVAVNAFWHLGLHEGYFAFFGMAAVMAATQKAPLMAIFLTVEMGQAYHLILPVATAGIISYIAFRLISHAIANAASKHSEVAS